MKYYLAIDLGASSGRHIVGYMENGKIEADEVYRFSNSMVEIDGHLTWDVEDLFKNVKEGIKEALKKYPKIESVGIDTWGVDYVLLNGDKEILPCYAYRDYRTKEVIDEVHSIIPFEHLYSITGSQFQEFNTIYQLYSDKVHGRLNQATSFLHIPEYMMYRLTGVKVHEYTNASTTGMLDANTNFYSEEIINKLGLKKELFTELKKPGENVGLLKKEIADEVGGNMMVKLVPTHDTAAAVEGIPFNSNDPYLSSGTWSLLGIKLDKAITSLDAMKANYSNEYGPDYIRFQKNIMGMWCIQGLKKEYDISFLDMPVLAQESTYMEIFDINDNRFLSSLHMSESIKSWFVDHGITPPVEVKDILNTTYRSLAYSYKVALEELEKITNHKYNAIYIVGGGAKNSYMTKLTKEFTGYEVYAYPIEASSIGNLLSQMEENK